MPYGLDKLIGAIAHSVIEAENLVRRAHISAFKSYFDDNQEPKAVDIKLPSVKPGAAPGAHERLHVPLLALVHPRQLSIEEMTVELSVQLGDLEQALATPPQSGAVEAATDRPGPTTSPPTDAVSLGVSVTHQGPGLEEASAVKIELKLRAEPIPEGVARLQDRLVKTYT